MELVVKTVSLTKTNTNLELSRFLPFCSFTIITESPSWAAWKGKVGTTCEYRSKQTSHLLVIFSMKWGETITWWLRVLRGVVLQSRWRGSWGECNCSAGAEVRVQRPHLSPCPVWCPHWAGEVAGALARHAPWAGGAAGWLWRFTCCWTRRWRELEQSAAGGQKAGAEEKVTGVRTAESRRLRLDMKLLKCVYHTVITHINVGSVCDCSKKPLFTYKSLCDRTMACELPLWRKDDWPPETMVRSCL